MGKCNKLLKCMGLVFASLCFIFLFADTSVYAENWSDAVEINVNTNIQGNVSSLYEQKRYKFTLAQDGYVTVRFSNPLQGDSSDYWVVYLFNGAYSEIASMTVYGNNSSTDMTSIGLAKGTYYIKAKIKAAGNNNYKAKNTTITFKVIVK